MSCVCTQHERFLLSAVMADMLSALLVRGEQHPSSTALPAQAMQRAFE